MVISPQHLEDINKAPLDIVSLHAVAKDFLRPKDTMNGFEWKDVRGIEETGFVRTLRTILTGQLLGLLPNTLDVVGTQITAEVKRHRISSQSSSIPLYDTCKRLVTKVNRTVFFGASMASNPEFFDAAYRFPHESAYAAEFIRLLPQGVGGFVARCFTGNFKAAATLHRLLSDEVTKRLEVCSSGGVCENQQYSVFCNDMGPTKFVAATEDIDANNAATVASFIEIMPMAFRLSGQRVWSRNGLRCC
ncbi:hypothetical protein OPT61_g4316 [Boeremia exigua]|uniref:Uncharacterized protein n=1 Tax=Boeremia exigua TaxID=749465 RepID=A0ACC2IEM3_9PLEO|nr:hypothetical protein OPT61_g4316 [Boeremia exigua]